MLILLYLLISAIILIWKMELGQDKLVHPPLEALNHLGFILLLDLN